MTVGTDLQSADEIFMLALAVEKKRKPGHAPGCVAYVPIHES
jgi:hypothetical protein